MHRKHQEEQLVVIHADGQKLEGTMGMPPGASGIVLFAHGSGSSRHSPRNRFVAKQLRKARIGTLRFDLLTGEEDALDQRTGALRFDIDLLARRLAGATAWLLEQDRAQTLPLGYFGASTGAAAALKAAAHRPAAIRTIVSRGGRPDLADEALTRVTAPVLLIVGGLDTQVIRMNQDALGRLKTEQKEMKIVEGAGHLFEEPGKLENVAGLARDWFGRWFAQGC